MVTTANGDDGYTDVIGTKRLHKNSDRIEAIGSVDELQSWIGLLRTILKKAKMQSIYKSITLIQNDLFDLGSDLACAGSKKSPLALTSSQLEELEELIVKYNKNLPTLRSFILPGSSESDAWLHICRAVCRRAERKVAQLTTTNGANKINQIYLNRLGDLLFIWSRYLAHTKKTPEILWENRKEVRSKK